MDREELFQREEDCQKAIRTMNRAIFMRAVVSAALVWAVVVGNMELWVIGLMVLVMFINAAGTLPLIAEWKKQRQLLKDLIAQEE